MWIEMLWRAILGGAIGYGVYHWGYKDGEAHGYWRGRIDGMNNAFKIQRKIDREMRWWKGGESDFMPPDPREGAEHDNQG